MLQLCQKRFGQLLLDRITREDSVNHAPLEHDDSDDDSDRIATEVAMETSRVDTVPVPSSASYPQGCLVFVRNVHPETNKTTLRALFSQAFYDSESSEISGDVVDYVDFNKGSETVRVFYL